MISYAGHLDCVVKVHDVLFARQDSKKHVVWLLGVPSSGKSKFCEQLSKILNCQYVEFNADHITTTEKDHCHAGVKTQVVLCPEVTLWAAFGHRLITKTLQFFDG